MTLLLLLAGVAVAVPYLARPVLSGAVASFLPGDTEKVDQARELLERAHQELRCAPEQSLDLARQALAIAEEEHDQALTARAWRLLGLAHSSLGLLTDAGRDLEQALQLYRALEQPLVEARLLGELGDVHEKQGELDLAIEHHLDALRIYEEYRATAPATDVADCLTALGVVHYRLGQQEEALEHFQRALVIQQAAGSSVGISNNLNNIGVILKDQQRYREALDNYRRALELRRQLGDDKGVADSLNNIAIVSYEMGELHAALDALQQCLEMRQQMADRLGTAMALANIGELYRGLGDHERSLDFLRRGRRLAAEIGAKQSLLQTLLELSRTHEARGDLVSALARYKEYAALQDELLSAEVNGRINELQTRFEVQQKESQIALLTQSQRAQQLVRNSLIVVSVLLALVAGLVLRSYLVKRRSAAVIRAKNRELEAVERIVYAINRTDNLASLLDTLLEQALRSTQAAEAVAFLIRTHATNRYRVVSGRGLPEPRQHQDLSAAEVHNRYLRDAEEILPDVFIRRCPKHREDAPGEAGQAPQPCSMLVLVIRLEGEIEGLLVMDSYTTEHAFDNQDVHLLDRLKEHLLSAFAKAQMTESLRDLSDAKSEVIRIAAHDIRSPLTGIVAGLQTLGLKLNRGELSTEAASRRIGSIMTLANQTIELLERLLDLSAIESGQQAPRLEPVDLCAVLQRSFTTYHQVAARKEIELTMGSRSVPMVLADAMRLGEVVDNLLSNAIKYTYPGGRVRLDCAAAHDGVVVSVADSGQGLSNEDLEQVFRSFRLLSARPTAGESSKGLGLAIAKAIVEKHNGRIWVESSQGQGATFSFSIPAIS